MKNAARMTVRKSSSLLDCRLLFFRECIKGMLHMSSFSYDPHTDICFRTLDFLGFSGYRVGDDGSVWSCRKRGGSSVGKGGFHNTEKWIPLKQLQQPSGHLRVSLNNQQRQLTHRLVLLAFIGPCPEGMECCHKNDTPHDNNLTNLYWGTRKQNGQDKARNRHAASGESNGNTTLTASKVINLRSDAVTHKCNPHWARILSTKYKIAINTVRRIVAGTSWKYT